ncbi:hypothetical protein N825_21680 [Skermanella stibiiresistens SB22]|uniref:Uncharacterized protein n=1 Tax=Skermanella stibiiresistens SB22 TaxID=1385369 RepID=W9GTF0_9PROT|nr:hypothetical protein [Skermanella stibiiresistens]EWY37059.1 hypothetical protein N825_21680 [Skermanella stibiiresistens SB22]
MGSVHNIDPAKARGVREPRAPDNPNPAEALRRIGEQLAETRLGLTVAEIHLVLVSDRLDRVLDHGERTMDFVRECQEARELTDIAEMERVRDRLRAVLTDLDATRP